MYVGLITLRKTVKEFSIRVTACCLKYTEDELVV